MPCVVAGVTSEQVLVVGEGAVHQELHVVVVAELRGEETGGQVVVLEGVT